MGTLASQRIAVRQGADTTMTKAQMGMAALTVGVLAVILWDSPFSSFLHRDRNRREVLALYEDLQLGMTKQQVGDVMDSGKYPHLQFYRGDTGKWSGSAPLEFGAGNWVVLIEFLREHVSALRVRTADSDHDHPAEAPPDKSSIPGSNARFDHAQAC
jgi:hypothetical protein